MEILFMNIEQLQTCRKCGVTKPAASFEVRTDYADKRRRTCRACRYARISKEMVAQYRQNRSERQRITDKLETERNQRRMDSSLLQASLPNEKWRPIDEFPRYRVSSLGRIAGLRGKFLRSYSQGGYRRVALNSLSSKKQWKVFVHNLVALAFIGPTPPGHEVNHKDGNKANNRLENLEYVTPSANRLHAYRVLGKGGPRGSEHGGARLSEALVIDIRRKAAHGATGVQLAHDFGIAVTTANNIISRRTWRHAEEDFDRSYSASNQRNVRETL